MWFSFLVLVFIFVKVKKKPESVLNAGIVVLLSSITFSWYFVVPSGIPGHILDLVNYIVSNFRVDLFNSATRPSEIFATHQVGTIASSINWTLYIIVHFLMVIGILVAILNKQDTKLDFKYRIMILLCSVLLLLSVVVPNFSSTFNFSRFYAVCLLFLAPCFVIGGLTLFSLFKKVSNLIIRLRKTRVERLKMVILLIAIILSAYFLSSYGFINRFAGGAPQSYILDWNRIGRSSDPSVTTQLFFVCNPEQDVFRAT